ncbi:uncharacterized protein [Watersipora subatra]|uniref:uncharacterized protein isoform X2 n=1 Tax=Watersipora subatra TaxID=2589382 RepID=UPI00355BD6FE
MEKGYVVKQQKRNDVIQVLTAVVAISALVVSVYSQISYQWLKKEVDHLTSRLDQLEGNGIQVTMMSSTDMEQVLQKRSAEDEGVSDGILSQLSPGQLSYLRGPPGRDCRDGRDGRDCEESDLTGLKTRIEKLVNYTKSVVARPSARHSDNELLQEFNQTIAHGLLSLLQSNNGKLKEIERQMQEDEEKREPSSAADVQPASGGGSSYIRWGRKSCANTSQLLYTGLAAGQHYGHEGGSSVYTCLPSEPEYNSYLASSTGNYIYGGEYQTDSNIFPSRMHDQNVPCSRCYLPSRSTTIMIPAKRTCPLSWNKEYEGYLMSGLYSQKRAYNYVCMDKEPEALTGLHTNTDGALFYFVQGACGELGYCPPYIANAELTCVVCSK